MKLISMDYGQFEGKTRQWRLSDLTLRDINLLVGKNASGKSRTLNVIVGLAKLLEPTTKLVFESGNYNVVFDHEGSTIKYNIKFEQHKIVSEEFILNDRPLLNRGDGGVGTIWAEKIENVMDFQAPEDQLAAVVRQDSIQHPFLAPLQQWARSLYYYPFGTPLGKDRFIVEVKDPHAPFDPKDFMSVVAIFKRGIKSYDGAFKDSLIRDMDRIGYPLDDIGLQVPLSISISGPIPGPLLGLYVHEKALADITDQGDMSQGMFRALSVLIQLTYAQMSNTANTVIIDDIGEGLDFERSCALIKLLIEKATQSKVQLIIATNDRFIMNSVPLESWSILQRSGGDSRVFNYANSKSKFDAFKFTGMNNFDFFATDFISSEEIPQN
jgi:energy-coupling factor transporter ATP-binding protein EcfA2